MVHSGSLPHKWKTGIVNKHKVTFFFFNCLQRRTRRNILLQSPRLILFSIVPSVISVLLPYSNRLCGGIVIIPMLFREFTVFLLFSMNVKGSQVFVSGSQKSKVYIGKLCLNTLKMVCWKSVVCEFILVLIFSITEHFP